MTQAWSVVNYSRLSSFAINEQNIDTLPHDKKRHIKTVHQKK